MGVEHLLQLGHARGAVVQALLVVALRVVQGVDLGRPVGEVDLLAALDAELGDVDRFVLAHGGLLGEGGGGGGKAR